jgi:hypothetical protein
VIAGNGEILLSNNRPILLRKRLKHWKLDSKTVGGSLNNGSFQELLCSAIEQLMAEMTV